MADTTNSDCINNQQFFTGVRQRLPDVAKAIKLRANDEPEYEEYLMTEGDAKKVSDSKEFLVERNAGSQIVPDQALGLGVTYGDEGCELTTKDGVINSGSSECSALGCSQIEAKVSDLTGDCGGTRHIIDSAEGFFKREGVDRKIKAGTDVKCLNTLEGLTDENRLKILNNHVTTLENSLRRSRNYSIIQHVANNAGSNFIAKGRNNPDGVRPEFTSKGWECVGEDEIDHITLYQLCETRERIGALKYSYGMISSIEDYIMPVLITEKAYDEMMYRYETVKASTRHRYRGNDVYAQNSLIRYNKDMSMTEKTYQMGKRTRKSLVWEGKIEFMFTNNPMKAYQVPDGVFPDGKPRCRYELIPRFLDKATDSVHAGGIGAMSFENPQWREDFYFCDGTKHEVLESILILDPDSFSRHPLLRGANPNGVTSTPVDLSIQLKHGDSIPPITGCPNEDDTQFYYFAEWWVRYMNMFPEFSGIGWHRPNRLQGWNSGLTPVDSNYGKQDPEACGTLANAESCKTSEPCDQDPCAEEVVCTEADNITSLDPCGAELTAPFFGNDDAEIVRLKVCRDEACSEVADAKIGYALSPVPANEDECIIDSVYGTDYTLVDEDGNALPDSGSITFLAGESGCKYICVQLLQAAPTLPAEDPEGPCCEENEPKPQFTGFCVKLDGASGTTLDDCTEVCVKIENAQ